MFPDLFQYELIFISTILGFILVEIATKSFPSDVKFNPVYELTPNITPFCETKRALLLTAGTDVHFNPTASFVRKYPSSPEKLLASNND